MEFAQTNTSQSWIKLQWGALRATSFRINLEIYTLPNVFLGHNESTKSFQPSHFFLLLNCPSFRPRSSSTSYPIAIDKEHSTSTRATMSPITNTMLANNMTQPHGLAGTSSSAFSTATPLSFPSIPQWGPDDIGTLVFGLIASVLGVLTLCATFWLRRRGALHAGGDGAYEYID